MDTSNDLTEQLKGLSMKQKIEILSFGLGGSIVVLSMVMYIVMEGTRPIAGSMFVAGMVVSFLPYGLYMYFRDRRYRKMEEEFPAFLRNLSESIKSGQSLPEAFKHASRTDYGQIDDEIRRASHQISWGIPFPEVMNRLSDRIKGSSLIRRSIFIILQSYESGGNISETLDAIAANTSKIRAAEREKKSVLTQQVYIIYAIHFLFIGIVIALYMLLSSFLLDMGSGGGFGGGGMGGGFGFGPVPNFCSSGSIAKPLCTLCPTFGLGDPSARICYYKALFLMMIVVEGIFNGLVAGEVLDGKVSAGVKHSLVMAPVGFFIYIVAMTVL